MAGRVNEGVPILLNTKEKKRFMIGNMYLYLVTGILVLCISAIQLNLREEYSLTQSQGGLLISLQATGYLITNLLGGHLAILTGRKPLLYLSAALMGIPYALLPLVPVASPVFLYVLLFIAGLGWGIVNNLLNVTVTEVFNGDGAPLTAAHTCYAIGAFISPLLVSAFFSGAGKWRGAAITIALLCFSLFLSLRLTPIPEKSASESKQQANSMTFLKDLRFYIFFFIFFLYVGSENAFSGWIVSYLVKFPFFTERLAQTMLSLLWVLMIIGRMLTAALARKLNGPLFTASICTGYAIMSAILLLSPSPYVKIASIVLMGLCMAGVFSISMSNASDLVIGSGLAGGLLLSAGGFGSIVLPYVAGGIADSSNLTSGMWFLAGMVVLLALLSIIIFLLHRRRKAKQSH